MAKLEDLKKDTVDNYFQKLEQVEMVLANDRTSFNHSKGTSEEEKP